MNILLLAEVRKALDEADAVPEKHNTRCSSGGVSDNIRHFMHYGRDGKPVEIDQAKAIAMSLLSKGCGAPKNKSLGTKKILRYKESVELEERTAAQAAERGDLHTNHANYWEREIGKHPKGSHKQYQAMSQSLHHRKEAWKHYETAHDQETDPGLKKAHERASQAAYQKMKMLHPHLQAAHAAMPTRYVG